jgi:tetratricopeptide (TPR) repeat protein
MSRPRFTPIALALALALASGSARAIEDPDTEIARRHFETGRDYYEAGNYQAALKEFEAARAVRPFPAFEYNIGRCYDRLERPSEAVAAYERYLAAAPDVPDADEVRERIRVLKLRIAVESPAPPPAPPPPPAPSRKRLIAPLAVGGAAVVVAAVGAGLLGSVKADFDDLASGPNSCRPCSDAQIAPLETRADAGYALLGTAGALAVVDVVLWARALRHRRAPGVHASR